MKLVAASVLPLLLLAPRPADACTFAGNGVHELDPAFATDTTPPSEVTASANVRWFDQEVAGGGVSSCADIASIEIMVSATDDAAPADRLGYQVRLVGGELPPGLTLPAEAIVPPTPGLLGFQFVFESWPGVAFDLEIRAVDLNGNLGPPTVLAIEDVPPPDDGGGCSTSTTPGAALALLALAFVLRRRG